MRKISWALEKHLLGKELSILMSEMSFLLPVVGAAARFVQCLDADLIPHHAVQPAALLALTINALPALLLQEALHAGGVARARQAHLRRCIHYERKRRVYQHCYQLADAPAQRRTIQYP